MASARTVDENGYILIEDNPISREGVFQYLGSSIDPSGSMGLEPGKVYNVYRPASELSDPACLDSMKLLPFIDDHAMLGPSDEGYLPPEKKGVHGTTGDQVDFRNGVLYSNLKIFSETLAALLKQGKKDLSLGYRCLYEKAQGTFAGQAYDIVQRSLRGNHIALVNQARCNVAVLDGHQLTLDHFDLNLNHQEDQRMTISLDEADKAITELKGSVSTLVESNRKLTEALDAAIKKMTADADEDKDKKEGEGKDADEDKDKEKDGKAEDEDDEDKKDKEKSKAMDEAISKIGALTGEVEKMRKEGIKAVLGEVSKRDTLARQLTPFIGTFDHAEMTAADVAAYGVEKLGIKCDKGQEATALAGYLHGRTAPGAGATTTFDGKDTQKSKGIDAYLTQKTA